MARPRRAIPTGTLTFLFTDIEGSTALLEQVSTERYRELLEEHQRRLRAAFVEHGGIERSTEGDSFFVVFDDAASAVAAAADGQRSLDPERWAGGRHVRVRMGLHTGQAMAGGDDYVGLDIHRAARIAASAHGGQVIISEPTRVLAAQVLPAGVDIIDLGEHRLRGISAPEHLYQLRIDGLPSEFPPPRTETRVAGNLPTRLTSFVGREAELEALRRLVGANRLVTLVGPGGAGKTTLAIECARGLQGEFRDGGWFVPLESVTDAEGVAGAILTVLRHRELEGRSAEEQLEGSLTQREILLVLDNLEQARDLSGLIGTTLASAPKVTVVATSRSPIHVAGEQVYPVDPLPVPARPARRDGDVASPVDQTTLEDLLDVASVRLFVDRVRQLQPAFDVTAQNAEHVSEICARLDGLPLGIELAAARVPLLGVAGVAERLSGSLRLPGSPAATGPARQRTLEAAIAWSHDLLDPAEQALFGRLGAFVGGWGLEEAETVCGPASELGGEVIDLLAALVDQSLVVSRPVGAGARFEMLETIRRYAVDRLEQRDDGTEVRRRHAAAFLAIAEESAPLVRRRTRAALDRVAPERDNFRAAVRWLIDDGDTDRALRLATALVSLRGAPPVGTSASIREASDTIVAALEMPGADGGTTTRMRALEAAGTAFYYRADNARAADYYRRQLELAEELGDKLGATDARFNLWWTEDWARRSFEWEAELLRLERDYRALGDDRGQARVMHLRGQALLLSGRARDAIAMFEAAMSRYEQLDDVSFMSMTIGALGNAYLELGDRTAACHWFIRSIANADAMGDEVAMTLSLPIGAFAATELGRHEAAAMLMGAHEILARATDARAPIPLRRYLETYEPLERARSAMDPLDFEAALARGREMSLQDAVSLVLELDPVAATIEP